MHNVQCAREHQCVELPVYYRHVVRTSDSIQCVRVYVCKGRGRGLSATDVKEWLRNADGGMPIRTPQDHHHPPSPTSPPRPALMSIAQCTTNQLDRKYLFFHLSNFLTGAKGDDTAQHATRILVLPCRVYVRQCVRVYVCKGKRRRPTCAKRDDAAHAVAARKKPCDESVLMLSKESLGVLRSPVAHSRSTYGSPKKSSMVAAVHGIGSAVKTSLLPMLYATLSAYLCRRRGREGKYGMCMCQGYTGQRDQKCGQDKHVAIVVRHIARIWSARGAGWRWELPDGRRPSGGRPRKEEGK
jgi:hypothetical protein